MNDDLTPDERAALRARIVGGARDIKPAGAHRGGVIAGSIAAVLVVAVAGGVAATSTLSAPRIATTPSPSATAAPEPTPAPDPSSTPTPTYTPTPTPTALPVALGGDCTAVLTTAEVSELSGTPMSASAFLPVWDARWLGGVDCQWLADDPENWRSVNVTVLPWESVPDEVRAAAGVVPVCEGGGICDYAQRFGDAWVAAAAFDATSAVAAVEAAGARAALSPGVDRPLAASAWSLTDCEGRVRDAVATGLGRSDLRPIGTDNVPQGQVWNVLTARGHAAWCSYTSTSYEEVDPPNVRVSLAAGARAEPDEVVAFGGLPVAVAGADAAWWIPAEGGFRDRVLASAPGGVVEVEVGNLTQERALVVAAEIIAALG